MKHTAFQYKFTAKELRYFFFAKKKCPNCGGKLHKRREYKTVGPEALRSRSDPMFFVQDSKVKLYVYSYLCEDCGKLYLLNELAENSKIRKGDM